MNKLVKGAVAGAAGIALLLGGASTFALWNASATADAGVVQSGRLTLERTAPRGTWTDLSTGTPTPIGNIATYSLVPGATIQFRQPLAVTAEGDHLRATLAADFPGSTTGLGDVLTKTITVSAPDSATAPAGFAQSDDGWTITAGSTDATTTPFVATYTLQLPEKADNTTQNGTVDLSQLAFTLTQQSISGS